MPSIRTDKAYFPFFKNKSTGSAFAEVGESVYRNPGYSNMVLEVSGEAVGYVEGCVNISNFDGSEKNDSELSRGRICLINKEDFSLSDGFTKKGHYEVAINGMQKIRVVLESVGEKVIILGAMEV